MCITFRSLSLEVPQTPRCVWLGACQACCPHTGPFGSQEAGHWNGFFLFSRSRSRSQQGPHSTQPSPPSIMFGMWHFSYISRVGRPSLPGSPKRVVITSLTKMLTCLCPPLFLSWAEASKDPLGAQV